ncbi:MAG: hypothetical protein GF416_00265 [Candidatus Altiarchaeales archaeon]|nr:hypothetical protein [Candidatus Altiarchaeales archaeon]MBD3415555.1 hypothetical protein [Candidatus Altiarchaeales archaeon]
MKDSFLQKEYGLKDSQLFKSRTATKDDVKLIVSRKREQKTYDKILEDSMKTSKTNFLVFFVGNYGMGKTLSLLDVKERANNKGAYPIYLTLQSEEKISKPEVDFIQRVLKEINFDEIKVETDTINELKKIYPDVGNVFQRIFTGEIQTSLYPARKNPLRNLAISFLVGDVSPTKNELNKIGVIRKIDRVRIAKEYLIGLLYILGSSGFQSLVICVDEFEYLFSVLSKSQQSTVLAFFRSLYDLQIAIPDSLKSNAANMALFIAVSSDGWKKLTTLGDKERKTGGPINALKERITELISLDPLTEKDTINLIEKRLSYDRVRGKYKNEPLIPFTDDFVEYLFKLTQGTPREIIVRCDSVLDRGLEKEVPRLTKEFAKEVFKERGLSYI